MFENKFFAATDGTQICYVDEGSGRPIIFIHGYTGHKGEYIDAYGKAILDAGFRFIAMDMRATKPTELSKTKPVTLNLLADDVYDLIKYLGLNDVTLVGHSQGGKDIMCYVLGHGNEYLHSICLLDTTPCTHQEDGFGYATRFDSYTKEMSDADIAVIKNDPIDFFARLRKTGNPDLTDEEAREAAAQSLVGQNLTDTVDLYESSNNLDLRAAMPLIKVPTAYLYAGEGTLIHPEIYKWFGENISADYFPIPFPTNSHGFLFMPDLIPAVTEAMIEFFRK